MPSESIDAPVAAHQGLVELLRQVPRRSASGNIPGLFPTATPASIGNNCTYKGKYYSHAKERNREWHDLYINNIK
jgi:hypothetical protein